MLGIGKEAGGGDREEASQLGTRYLQRRRAREVGSNMSGT